MPYNKEELLKLNVQEKMMLVEELWDSIDEELLPVSEELQQIAKERYEEHLSIRMPLSPWTN